jgi:hypothetical protein
MEGEKISCPKCGSNDYTFTEETRVYTCKNCNHDFTTVFISYGHDEYSDLAFKIEEDLLKEGIIVWIDKSELHAGKDWELRIERGLLGTQIVISMLTPHSVGREEGFCLDELSLARSLGRKIIPIMVRDVIPPLSIHRIQWLDFREWPCSEEIYKKKVAEILDIIKGKLLSFDGRHSTLLNMLKPINFGADIDMHIRNFYGRDWVFDIIDNWFKSDSASKVFLLTGSPGIGKTAISAMLCHKYSDCAVYHLVKYNDARKSNALECILSLAFQLATRLPKYAEKLLYIDFEGIREKNANTVFDELFVQPLHNLPKLSKNILIIIDALDEATKANKNELVRLIADNFELTPSWLKLFITTRPEKKIRNTLAAFNPTYLKTEDERNIQDIKGYLKKNLIKLFPDSNISKAVDIILRKSEGIFLYVQQVIEEIKKDRLKLENPEQFPQGLNGIFQMFFERQFQDPDSYNEFQRPLLSTISAAYEPLNIELIKKVFGDNNLRFKRRFEPMGSLLEIKDGFVKPFHKSLIEWVTNEEIELEFFIDIEEGHNIIINHGWKLYKSDVTEMHPYFLDYLPQHLLAIDVWDKLTELLSDLKYIETCCKVGEIYNLIKNYSEILVSKDISDKDKKKIQRYGQFVIFHARQFLHKEIEERTYFMATYPDKIMAQKWYALFFSIYSPKFKNKINKYVDKKTMPLNSSIVTSTLVGKLGVPIKSGERLKLIPNVEEIIFQPPGIEVAWSENLQLNIFTFLANENLIGHFCHGAIDIYSDFLLRAQIPFSFRVYKLVEEEEFVSKTTQIFNKIYISYSHKDSEIVEKSIAGYKALGIKVLTNKICSGQDWKKTIKNMINEADIFVLMWSQAARQSKIVEYEWKYSLSIMDLKGDYFFRPMLLEDPKKAPIPKELAHLHFAPFRN